MTTQELDNLAAEIAASLTTHHADYAQLAARIAVSNLHKETKKVFSGKFLYNFILNALISNIFNSFYKYSLQMFLKICIGMSMQRPMNSLPWFQSIIIMLSSRIPSV